MTSDLRDVCAAVIPRAGLPALADLRCHPDVRVVLGDTHAWVTWRSTDDAVLRHLLPVAGAEFFRPWNEGWQRVGTRLPATGVPFAGPARLLQDVLTPAAFTPRPPDDPRLDLLPLRLVRSTRPERATALLCRLTELATWAHAVPTSRLAALEAARRGDGILVRGARLPALPEAQRFWGEMLLLPLGWRLEPELPTAATREALGASSEEILVWSEGGPEAIATACFRPLSRAAIRLAEEQRSGT
jgi:hypothetical protein